MSKSKDFADAMTVFEIISWPLGTWPLQDNNLFAFIRFVVAIITMLLLVLIVNSEIYVDGTDTEANLDALMFTVCGLLTVLKLTCFRFNSADLAFNFASAREDYNQLNEEDKREIMLRHARMGKITSLGLLISSNICSMMFTVISMFVKKDEEIKTIVNDTAKYLIPSGHVMKALKVPDNLFLLIYFLECLLLVYLATGNIGSDSLLFCIIFHLCGQVEVLKLELTRLSDKNGKAAEKFRLLTKRHEYLLGLCKMLNNMIGSILVAQLSTSCLLICTCGFQFVLALDDNNMIMVVKTFTIFSTLLVQLFAYSYAGDYLKCQLESIGFSLYSSCWYDLSGNVPKDIIFVIMKAQDQFHLTAGKLFVVNLETYMSIVKTSISYLSVLRVMIST